MRKLFAVFLGVSQIVFSAAANEVSYRSLQSGSATGPTPIHDRGIHGEGQIIAVLDTGADYNSCYFAEPDNSPPPINTGSPQGGLQWQNVDTSRRKIIAYDFLFSCDQYPNATGCEKPGTPDALDNQGHGTHTASIAAGDRGTPLAHDWADALATGAKLIIQDGGLVNGDACTQFSGVGCPAQLTPVFEQAYRQGARIHSNSWGDRQGNLAAPPTANYAQSARDVDAFVYSHPDMLIVFNTGNLGVKAATPKYSLSAPGCAKNTLQIGGTRTLTNNDDTLAFFTLFGPTRDGRIKPDLVAPARVVSGSRDLDNNPKTCDDSRQDGTSFASPTVASAAALVRQYYTDGFYPSGVATQSNRFTPSAALLKATLIAAARAVPYRGDIVTGGKVETLPVPSHEQGWGFPVLDDALYFPGDASKLRVIDVPLEAGLAQGAAATVKVNVKSGTPFKAVLVWTDPPGHLAGVSDSSMQLVNDLDLQVRTATSTRFGNGATPDRLNNVEVVSIPNPESGTYSIDVRADRIGFGGRQGYALVVIGDVSAVSSKTRSVRR
ncbi:MAG: S8 family serine peptidase [Acidobacteriota bacterium]|nr:S8 family serine peptidase [Acidobacteriota bacterium]